MKTITVARRFCGPARSSNGGYFAGLVATLASDTLAVRLLKPPPLDTEMEVVARGEGAFEVRHGDTVIGEAKHAELRLELPSAVSYFEAVEASRRYTGFLAHRFPTCFVCGTQRPRGDGMRFLQGRFPSVRLSPPHGYRMRRSTGVTGRSGPSSWRLRWIVRATTR